MINIIQIIVLFMQNAHPSVVSAGGADFAQSRNFRNHPPAPSPARTKP